MTSQLKRLEQVLGGKIEQRDARVIPGTVPVEGQRVVYFSDDGKNTYRKQFKNLTTCTNPPYAASGGVNERGCKITLPDDLLFHAISYHGDLDGWCKDIEVGAQVFHLLLATIEDDKFVISDGRVFLLADCKIEFC